MEKVTNIIKKEFDSKPVYNEKHMRTKIRSYKEKLNTNFPNKGTKGKHSMYLSILIDSV